jgi:hypothetical protein
MGVKNTLSPYRISKQNWFPKFTAKCAPAESSVPATRAVRATQTFFEFEPSAGDQDLQPNGMPAAVELSLEGVKVVRNDLTDSDLEIVPKPKGSSCRRCGEEKGGKQVGPSGLLGWLFGAGTFHASQPSLQSRP